MIEVREQDGQVSFQVRVQPGARRNEIGGEWQGALRIRITEPARDDLANLALRRLLASRLKVPLGAVRIATGERSRTKRVEVSGVNATQVYAMAAPSAGKIDHAAD